MTHSLRNIFFAVALSAATAISGAALAEETLDEAVDTEKDSMATDTMKSDSMEKDTMSSDSMEKDDMGKDSMEKDSMEKDSMEKDKM